MDHCCESKACELAALRERQHRVLYAVLAINVTMFLVEFISSWIARSTALLGDSLDMLGDASVYAMTLYALRSTWLCSRNDLIANGSVLVAAGGVALTGTPWPDVAVGVAIALLFLHSAQQVLKAAWLEWRIHRPRKIYS